MRITLVTWQALGDTIVSLPIAFHLEAQGHEVSILNTRGNGIVQDRQYAPLLSTYPRLWHGGAWGRTIPLRRNVTAPTGPTGIIDDGTIGTPVAYGRVCDLTAGAKFNWQADHSMIADIAAHHRIVFEEAPRVPLLAKPVEYQARAAHLTGNATPYVLIAPEGSDPGRRLTDDQIDAVGDVARCVIAHHKPREYKGRALNLTGRTTLEDALALTACASAVVSVDTGVWHLAPAFLTPTVGVVGRTSNPRAIACDYMPTLYLQGRTCEADVPPDVIAQAVSDMHVTKPLAVGAWPSCGVRWWETSEVQTRLAVARAHQERILQSFGGTNVIEVAP